MNIRNERYTGEVESKSGKREIRADNVKSIEIREYEMIGEEVGELGALISELKEALEELSGTYFKLTYEGAVDHGYYNEIDGIKIEIHGYRWETDDELKARLAKEEKSRKAAAKAKETKRKTKLEKEKEDLKRLYKKYGKEVALED